MYKSGFSGSIIRQAMVVSLMLVFFVFSENVNAQRWKLLRYEVIGSVGGTSLFSDLGGAPSGQNWLGLKDIQIKETKPIFDIAVRYKYSTRFWIKGGAFYGQLAATDEGSDNENRGFQTITKSKGGYLQLEYAIIPEDKRSRRVVFNNRGFLSSAGKSAFYVFGGVRFGSFSPTLSSFKNPALSPEEVAGASGSTITESQFALSFPVGVGYKMFLDNRLSIGAELAGCISTSDFLDGYTSSWSKANDAFYLFNVTVAYKLRTKKNGWPLFRWK
jgi:hypothetical protein